MRLIYDIQILHPSKQVTSVAYASVINTALNQNQQMSHILFFKKETHPTRSAILYEDNACIQSNRIRMQSRKFLKRDRVLTMCLCGFWLTYLPVDGSPGGRDPGLRTGELAGLQSSGKGLGMAGSDDVLSCCSSTCNLLIHGSRETGQRKSHDMAMGWCLHVLVKTLAKV